MQVAISRLADPVEEDAQAARLMLGAQAWLRLEGLRFDRPKIRLILDAPDGRPWRRRPGQASRTLGETRVRWTGFPGVSWRATVEGIVILRGLSRLEFEGTLVHELGHAWLADQQIGHLSQVEEEGFCQCLEHRWLLRLPGADAQNLRRSIETSSDPVYGTGFRRMHVRAAALGGLRPLVENMRRGISRRRWWHRHA